MPEQMTILFERYKIITTLSQNAVRMVYQARDMHFPNIQKLVVIKESIPAPNSPSLLAQMTLPFQREANLLASLDHPAIPKVFEFTAREGRAYLITEFIRGTDLAAHMANVANIPVRQIVEWGMALCDALTYLHTHSLGAIIHRNLLPANLLIDTLGRVRVVGFSKVVTTHPGERHEPIQAQGYAPPEALMGVAAPTVDIYMLAGALHHLITRIDPATQPRYSFDQHPLRDHNPAAPEALEDILLQALAFNPAERFQTAAEFKAALAHLH